MNIKTVAILAIFILGCGLSNGFSQTRSKSSSILSISLSRIPYQVNYGSADKFKVKNISLLGFKKESDDWIYVFHLKDQKTGLEIGKELTTNTSSFLICTDETIGTILMKQKDNWINQKINLYLEGRDLGLTPFMNIGFVTKLELLDEKGKIIKTIS